MWHEWETEEVHTTTLVAKPEGKGNLKRPGVKLKWIFTRQNGNVDWNDVVQDRDSGASCESGNQQQVSTKCW